MKMTKTNTLFLILFVGILAVPPVLADSSTPGDPTLSNQWKGNLELGFVKTSGNTDTETLNTKASAKTDREVWRHKINAEALKTSDHGTTTAERYAINGQSDYKLKGKKNFFFAYLAYEDDHFSGYKYQMTEAIGYGRRLLDEPNMKLDLEVGPGARQRKVEATNETEKEGLVRGAVNYLWNISETSNFTENLSTEVGKDVTITKSVTALVAKINSSLASKVTYTIKNTSKVPAGIKKTDTETGVTLVYSF
jgi:putative salt-induced outer membrane protein